MIILARGKVRSSPKLSKIMSLENVCTTLAITFRFSWLLDTNVGALSAPNISSKNEGLSTKVVQCFATYSQISNSFWKIKHTNQYPGLHRLDKRFYQSKEGHLQWITHYFLQNESKQTNSIELQLFRLLHRYSACNIDVFRETSTTLLKTKKLWIARWSIHPNRKKTGLKQSLCNSNSIQPGVICTFTK